MTDRYAGKAADLQAAHEDPKPGPVEALAGEYDRLRRKCLSMQANGFEMVDGTTALTAWLRQDIDSHFDLENQHILPLLRLRSAPDDEVEAISALLMRNHQAGKNQVRLILSALEEETPPSALFDDLSELAARERQHISLVIAVILPLLRLRLLPEDMPAILPHARAPADD